MRTTISTRTLIGWGLAGGTVTAALFGLGALIVNAVADEPDPAACKTAMAQQFQEGMQQPAGEESTRPPECEGIDQATLERLAGEVMAEALDAE